MDDSKTNAGKVDSEEEVGIANLKQIDLANNIQARYASPHRPSASKNLLFTFKESKIPSEISLGLHC